MAFEGTAEHFSVTVLAIAIAVETIAFRVLLGRDSAMTGCSLHRALCRQHPPITATFRRVDFLAAANLELWFFLHFCSLFLWFYPL